MTAEALMELGFNKRMATILSLLDEVPDNVQSRQNVELLKQCVDLNTLKEPLSGILIFLTREYETNLFMMSVPEKYGFTPQERKKYLSNPFNWEYECDLKEELDEQLQQIFTDEEKRMSIYRKLYLKGAWQACSVIPVSYTHLDVYKRQVTGKGMSTNVKANRNGAFSVRVFMDDAGTETYTLTAKAEGCAQSSTDITLTREWTEKELIAQFRQKMISVTYKELIKEDVYKRQVVNTAVLDADNLIADAVAQQVDR